jgi:hypothetical protein
MTLPLSLTLEEIDALSVHKRYNRFLPVRTPTNKPTQALDLAVNRDGIDFDNLHIEHRLNRSLHVDLVRTPVDLEGIFPT